MRSEEEKNKTVNSKLIFKLIFAFVIGALLGASLTNVIMKNKYNSTEQSDKFTINYQAPNDFDEYYLNKRKAYSKKELSKLSYQDIYEQYKNKIDETAKDYQEKIDKSDSEQLRFEANTDIADIAIEGCNIMEQKANLSNDKDNYKTWETNLIFYALKSEFQTADFSIHK